MRWRKIYFSERCIQMGPAIQRLQRR